MVRPVRYPNGINNANVRTPFYNIGLPDPSVYATYFDDFVKFTAADWTITKVGTGTTALSTATLPGGNLVVTNSAAGSDSVFLQAIGPSFKYTAGKGLAFKARFKVDDATLAGFVIGLQETDTTPLDVNNGIAFYKPAATAVMSASVEASNTASSIATVATIASDTYIEVGFSYEPRLSTVNFFANGALVGALPLTNMPTVVMTPSFGVVNGSGVVRIMTVDYILAMLER